MNQGSTTQTISFKAAIVDQESLTFPNQTFVMAATNVLTQAGYAVDYYRGQEVTVDLYRTLATHGYRLVILRVHSSATGVNGKEYPLALYTSERYSETQHVYEQLSDQLTSVAYSLQENARGVVYFGILPSFVTGSMQGSFQKTLVVMMGCQGLENTEMAKAFVAKGASVYVSWDRSVTPERTDTATNALIESLIQGKNIQQSVVTAMNRVGPDPTFNSRLGYYPDDQATLALNPQHNAIIANVQVLFETSVTPSIDIADSAPTRTAH